MNSYGVILELAGRGDAGRFVYVDDFAVVILLRLTSSSLCAGAQPKHRLAFSLFFVAVRTNVLEDIQSPAGHHPFGAPIGRGRTCWRGLPKKALNRPQKNQFHFAAH